MKRKILYIWIFALLFGLSACSSSSSSETASSVDPQGKVLVAYFSRAEHVDDGADASTYATPSQGNTATAAQEIAQQTGGNLFAIETEKDYPLLHSECSEIAEEEMRQNQRPTLTSHVENMEDYDIVFIGYPIWWYIEPMAIRSFIDEYDWTGKTIVPFCTSLGAGIGESQENIASLAQGANVLEGLSLSSEQNDVSQDVGAWLSQLGFE